MKFKKAFKELKRGNGITRKQWHAIDSALYNKYLIMNHLLSDNRFYAISTIHIEPETFKETLIPGCNLKSEDLCAEDWNIIYNVSKSDKEGEKIFYNLKPLEWEVINDSEENKAGVTTNGFFKYFYRADEGTKKYEGYVYKKYQLRFFKCPENSVSLLIGRFDTLKELKEAAQLAYEEYMTDNFIEKE